jgi:hypothetical protein
MLNNLSRSRLVGFWTMSVMTIGAWSIVSGAALTSLNGELLFAACILPPLVMVTMWRRETPVGAARETLLARSGV